MNGAAIALVVALSLAAGDRAPKRAPDRAPARAKDASPPKPGLSGVVTFKGAAPKPAEIDRSSDPFCGANLPDEALSVKDGKLANVLVRIVDGPKPVKTPEAPVVIDQTGCLYRPRVQGALDGQKILVRNTDGTLHNVHAYLAKTSATGKKATAFNKAQTPGSQPIADTFKAADGVLSVKCDIHPWMQAWVVPVETSYFAVTGPDGTFSFPDLPPGTYTAVAWHESLGTVEKKVTIPPGGAGAKVEFTFESK